MRWIVAVEEVTRVARIAGGRCSFEYIVDMACNAGQCGVRAGECITGIFQVVELGAYPVVHGVTGNARGGKPETNVVEHRGEKVLLMAGVAIRRQSLELSSGSHFVALFALDQGMRTN